MILRTLNLNQCVLVFWMMNFLLIWRKNYYFIIYFNLGKCYGFGNLRKFDYQLIQFIYKIIFLLINQTLCEQFIFLNRFRIFLINYLKYHTFKSTQIRNYWSQGICFQHLYLAILVIFINPNFFHHHYFILLQLILFIQLFIPPLLFSQS